MLSHNLFPEVFSKPEDPVDEAKKLEAMTPEERFLYSIEQGRGMINGPQRFRDEGEAFRQMIWDLVAESVDYAPDRFDVVLRRPLYDTLRHLNEQRKRDRVEAEREAKMMKAMAGTGRPKFPGRRR